MMNEREKLIKLLENGFYEALSKFKGEDNDKKVCDFLADFLLGNGVVVPPVKIGTKVYLTPVSGTEIYEHTIDGYRSITNGLAPVEMLIDVCWGNTEHIGKTVFLTREEAEKALAERSDKE